MMPMGPEALLVRFKTDARVDLAEFMRLEYAENECSGVEAAIRGGLDRRAAQKPWSQQLRRWGDRLLRRDDPAVTARPVQARKPVDTAADRLAETRALAGTTLAAMPATRARVVAEATPASLATVPIRSRV